MKLKQYTNYGLKLYLQNCPNPKSLVALDIGTSFTGTAISCNNLKKSYFLKSINSSIKNRNLMKKIIEIADETKCTSFVIGLPKSKIQYATSSLKQTSQIIKQFILKYSINDQKEQQQSSKIMPFTFVDESWSTKQSVQKLKEFQVQYSKWGHLHKQKQLVDGLAAMNILDRFLLYYNKW